MNSIIQLIEQVFSEKTLIGNHDFSEDEYSLMVDSVGALCGGFDKNCMSR
ncbi:MAG: hypothetical protein JXB49_14020 [Bacteroidales bacterium]|nr:hypothetical protein [Bacteroidales bacterium]